MFHPMIQNTTFIRNSLIRHRRSPDPTHTLCDAGQEDRDGRASFNGGADVRFDRHSRETETRNVQRFPCEVTIV